MFGLFKHNFQPFFSPASDFGAGGNDNADLSGEADQTDLDILSEDSEDDDEDGGGDDSDDDSSDDSEDSESDDDSGEESDDDAEEEEESDDKGKGKGKKKKEGDEEDEEEDEEDDEEEESDDDDLDDEESPESRTTVQAINKYDKKFLKKFPEVRRAIFVANEYGKVFGSIEDGREAAGKATILDGFTADIESGDVSKVINGIAQEMGKEHAISFAKGFLPSIAALDKNLYREVADPAVKMAIRALFNAGINSKNKNLVAAAQYASQFLWENDDVAQATSFKPTEKVDRTRENEFLARQLETSSTYVDRKVRSKLSKRIIEIIDPQQTRNSFERDALVDKAIVEVNRVLSKDKAHGAHLNSLWRKAQKNGFAADSLSKIIGAYIGRASASMPAILAKMKVSGKKVEKVKGKTVVSPESRSGRSESRKVANPGEVDYRRTSDADILNDKVTLKGQK